MKTLLLLLLSSSIAFAQATHRDGKWWIDQNALTKVCYVTGLRDGLGTAAPIVHAISEKTESEYLSAIARVYLKPQVAQFCAGLDEFYTDFRNTNIPVFKAMTVIAMQIGGASDEIIKGQTLDLRREAAR